MRTNLVIIASVFLAVAATSTSANVQEVAPSSLRPYVESGQVQGLGRVMEAVEERVAGEIVDVRVFYEDGRFYYRILVRQPNGKLGAAIMDAQTMSFLDAESEIAQDIQSEATTTSLSSLFSGTKTASEKSNNGKRSGGRSGGRGGGGGGHGGGGGGGHGGGGRN